MNKMNMPNITTDEIIKKIKEEIRLKKLASVISVQDKNRNDGILSNNTAEENDFTSRTTHKNPG